MRQFTHLGDLTLAAKRDRIDGSIRYLRSMNKALADALGLNTCLRPEASIMLELYEADRSGELVTVSMLGMLDAIAPSTSLRYVNLLEKSGAVDRCAHETDRRMSYVEISIEARRAMDVAFRTAKFSGSVSYKPTV